MYNGILLKKFLWLTPKVPLPSLQESINKHILGIVVNFKLTHTIKLYHTITRTIIPHLIHKDNIVLNRSVMSDSVTPWTVAHQAPLSMGFSRQEYWCGLPCPPPGDLPKPEIKPRSPMLQANSLPPEPPVKPGAYM